MRRAGADHLYIERYDTQGLTGDERDLLAALTASYLDKPLEAEAALGALLPPGETETVMGLIESITGGMTALQKMRVAGALPEGMPTAACH